MAKKTSPTQSEDLNIDGISVRVTYKRIRRLNLRISPDGKQVKVSAPYTASREEVIAFVQAHRAWIDKHMHAASQTTMAQACQATDAEIAQWKACVSACVPALIETWEPIMGVRAGRIAYRNMTSRWGSCQPATGRICINVRLALFPPECLEYVVVHELCHLLERGHGPKFQAYMDTFLPDWRARRAKLR